MLGRRSPSTPKPASTQTRTHPHVSLRLDPLLMRVCGRPQLVRVGLPSADVPPLYYFDASSGAHTGFLIELLSVMQREMGAAFTVVPLDTDSRSFYSSTSVLRSALQSGIVDAVPAGLLKFSDATTFREEFAVTSPFEQTEYTGIERKVAASSTAWRLFEPFTVDLWLAIGGTVAGMALAIALLMTLFSGMGTAGTRRQPSAAAAERIAQSTYHMAALILSGDDMEYPTAPLRIVRIAALLLALVLTATYTANLAAFFTKTTYLLEGPADYTELLSSAACGVLRSSAQGIEEYAQTILSPPINFSEPDKWSYCQDALTSGEASLAVHSRHAVRAFLNQESGRCDTYSELSWLGVGFVRAAFVLSQTKSEMATNISLTLDALVADPLYLELITNHMNAAECPTSADAGDTARVDWHAMRGLFFLVWSIAAVGVGYGYGLQRFHRHSDNTKVVTAVAASSTGEGAEGAALLSILEKLSRLEDLHSHSEHRRFSPSHGVVESRNGSPVISSDGSPVMEKVGSRCQLEVDHGVVEVDAIGPLRPPFGPPAHELEPSLDLLCLLPARCVCESPVAPPSPSLSSSTPTHYPPDIYY